MGIHDRSAATRALHYLEGRDAIGEEPEGSMTPFVRGEAASRASSDAIMARIHAIGSPDGLRIVPMPPVRSMPSRVRRIAMLATAAVFVAAISSVVTLRLIGAGSTVDVRFILVAPEASSVHLAADFNEWSPDGYDLEKKPDGTWEIMVPLRKGKAYAYNFVIDGERWIADPASSLLLDDGFGGSSSSLSL